jgi:protein required for attachment to host cells
MSKTWVLVADSSAAKIFKIDDGGALQEVADLVHSESRMHEQNVSSDLPGSNAGGGSSKHGFESQTGIKEHEAVNFAHEISEQLDAGRNNGQFNQLIVAAAPAFLGVLRETINPNTNKLITHEINKDLVKLSAAQIMDHLTVK